MTTTPADADAAAAPNHHADHPGFSGAGGLLFALCFTVGRGGHADLAIGLAGVGPDDDVVDVGCGPGVAVRRAGRLARSVVGVDPAPVMLRVARALGGPGGRYLPGTAEALPLPDDSATVVWSLATVHHWRDLEAGLREARRVLRPEGRLVAVERRIRLGASGVASHGWTERHAERFAELCRTAGFADAEVGRHRAGRGDALAVRASLR